MSTHVNDLAAAVAVSTALAPAVRTANATGPAIDMVSADGGCFAIQQIGALADAAWSGGIEESADGAAWAAVAAFAPVEGPDDTQTLSFRRTKRFVRYVGTIAGNGASVPVSAVVGEQRKTF